MKNKHMDINLKKLLIFPLTFFLFVSCSEEVSINIESGSESQNLLHRPRPPCEF